MVSAGPGEAPASALELCRIRHGTCPATRAAHGDENVLLLLLAQISAIKHLAGLLRKQFVQRERSGGDRGLRERFKLASPANCLGLPTRFLFGGFFVVTAKLHLAENALALHLLLQRLEGLIDVVVTDENLHACFLRL